MKNERRFWTALLVLALFLPIVIGGNLLFAYLGEPRSVWLVGAIRSLFN